MACKRLAFLVLLGLLSTVPACDDEPPRVLPDPCERVGHPDFTGPGYGVIGPQGGVVEETDPSSPLFGVRVEVPAGAWDECWEVYIQYESIFSTPDYPDGYVPFERPDPSGAVQIEIGLSTLSGFYPAPDPLPIQLSFPMDKIQPEAIEVRAAYFYDEEQQDWRIVFPKAMSAERLWVESSTHAQLWSWGLINIDEADFDRHVAPAMEDYYGSETWAEVQAAIDEIYRQGLEQQDLLICAGLDFAEGFFIGAREAAGENVQELQVSLDCGDCNAVSTEFYEEFVDYIKLNIQAMLAEMFVEVIPGGLVTFPLKLAAFAMWMSIEAAIDNLACDYDCFFSRAHPLIYVNVAVYYGSEGILEVIERYRNSDYISCPPAAVTEPLLMPPG
ncbi:MAG: hypothetical protein JRJ80_13525 [Deltaproteobacteria bacterium]|nr:hypothetical protein [Deltaproteobacteria bacterium]